MEKVVGKERDWSLEGEELRAGLGGRAGPKAGVGKREERNPEPRCSARPQSQSQASSQANQGSSTCRIGVPISSRGTVLGATSE